MNFENITDLIGIKFIPLELTDFMVYPIVMTLIKPLCSRASV